MNIALPSLSTLSPPAQRSIAITLGAIAACLLIVFVAIRPQHERIRKNALEIDALLQSESMMRVDIANTAKIKAHVAATNALLDTLLSSGVLEPLLGSYAMRGKSLLDPVAQQTGFAIESVRELSQIALQVPQPPPEQLYMRQPVEFTGQGSYEQIAAFIAQTEKAQPLAVLSGLTLLCQPQTPETHKAIITFEWPAKGEKVKPAPAPAAKGKDKKATTK
jgi:Tfp pilus assembly protein PilO